MRLTRRALIQNCLVAAAVAPARPAYDFVDATAPFLRLVEGAEGGSVAAAFRHDVVAAQRQVYRFLEPLEDGDITAYVERARGNLGPLRAQRSEFPPLFHALWTRFDASLKLDAGSAVYLLPAPADSLGGAVRFDGRRDVVLLGSEVMTFIQDAGVAGAVFVHHELAHLFHQQRNDEIRQAASAHFAGRPSRLYQMMWLEGLGVYLSGLLNPVARAFDLFRSRTLVAEMSAAWPRLVSEIREQFDASDPAVIDRLVFDGDAAAGIPGRTGYYFGYRLAQSLAADRTPLQLARLRGAELRTTLLGALSSPRFGPVSGSQ